MVIKKVVVLGLGKVGTLVAQLLHESGVPYPVLHYLPGEGRVLGATLTGDDRISGIAFTGSTDTARTLHRALAARQGAIGRLQPSIQVRRHPSPRRVKRAGLSRTPFSSSATKPSDVTA